MPIRPIEHGIFAGAAGGFTAITATGGSTTDFTYSGFQYRVHQFTSSGTFQITANPDAHTFDVYVLGGGGGHWLEAMGGAGGGGDNTQTGTAGTVQSYTVTVGAGGAGAGNLSSFAIPSGNTFYSSGGSYPETSGSGWRNGAQEGATSVGTSPPSPTYGGGNSGGGVPSGSSAAGGGGGNAGVGTDGSPAQGNSGPGANGLALPAFNLTSTIGGGGGGGQCQVPTWAAQPSRGYGYGGGGPGGWSAWGPYGGDQGTAGTANTGGGGGGCGGGKGSGAVSGGSGRVAVVYALEATS